MADIYYRWKMLLGVSAALFFRFYLNDNAITYRQRVLNINFITSILN